MGRDLWGIGKEIQEKNIIKASPDLEVASEAKIHLCIMGCEAEEMIGRNVVKCKVPEPDTSQVWTRTVGSVLNSTRYPC